MRTAGLLAGVLLLSACGGGGSGSAGTGVTPTPTPTPTATATALPTVTIALDPASLTIRAEEGATEQAFGFDARRTGTPNAGAVADVHFNGALIAQDGAVTLTGTTYRANFRTRPGLAPATYTGTIQFRLCEDATCANVYPGSAQSISYRIEVRLKGWQGFQRTPGHTGYVPATFDPADFAQVWTHSPAGAERIYPMTSFYQSGNLLDAVTLSWQRGDGSRSLTWLNAADGSGYSVDSMRAATFMSAPVQGDATVFLTAVNIPQRPETTELRQITMPSLGTLPATEGIARPIEARPTEMGRPTWFENTIYLAGGSAGNRVAAYRQGGISPLLWAASGSSGGVLDGQTPAVDASYVYYYSGGALDIFNRATGALAASIPDPGYAGPPGSYVGGPMVGTANNVLAYSGTAVDQGMRPRFLVNYSLVNNTLAWRSANPYVTAPAVARGTVYAARNAPARFDALNEASGALLWSWTPPAGESFLGNVIVTETLAFVSTDQKIYAISLTDSAHPTLWSAATPGEMMITTGSRLVVLRNRPGSYPNSIVAYRLRAP